MTANELGRDRLDDPAEIKEPGLLRHARVKDHLKQEIAELSRKSSVARVDRVGDLVGFLERVGGDRGEGLLDVPGAAGYRIAQRRHDVDKALNVARRLHGKGQKLRNGTEGLLER